MPTKVERDSLIYIEEQIMSSMPGAPRSSVIDHRLVTTCFELDGYRIVRSLGVVRGITVRSRSVVGTIGAALQTLVGGNITLLTKLCEKTREESFDLMLQHASELGANAVVGARYDATEIMQGVTEVLAYGTAVVVEKA
ncbi:MAG TPA: YbjQ family protein [Terriglobales bacterium]|nr:YbjQ family protein [Terriglobales bacterium]